MNSERYERLCLAVTEAPIAVAVILGSGLGSIVNRIQPVVEVYFADLPGFAAPTVHGHGGRVILGDWGGVRVLVFQGRMHFYEGHSWERATAPVRLAAQFGVRSIVLTNAAGGIRDDLNPGDLMGIHSHIKLLDAEAWKHPNANPIYRSDWMVHMGIPSGVYAALTGPTYETPAEIRALRTMGADAVGMSTAMEAEVAAQYQMQICAISCITNKAAGLTSGTLDHKEVQQIAGQSEVTERLANIIERLIVEAETGNA